MAADAISEPAERLHGLWPALTSFVGRDGAVDAVAGLLGKYRLVTGPGGMGKTRLADEVARQIAERFADGVWGVELATVAGPGLVPTAAATHAGPAPGAGDVRHGSAEREPGPAATSAGPRQLRARAGGGAALTLAAAVELAVMVTGEAGPAAAAAGTSG